MQSDTNEEGRGGEAMRPYCSNSLGIVTDLRSRHIVQALSSARLLLWERHIAQRWPLFTYNRHWYYDTTYHPTVSVRGSGGIRSGAAVRSMRQSEGHTVRVIRCWRPCPSGRTVRGTRCWPSAVSGGSQSGAAHRWLARSGQRKLRASLAHHRPQCTIYLVSETRFLCQPSAPSQQRSKKARTRSRAWETQREIHVERKRPNRYFCIFKYHESENIFLGNTLNISKETHVSWVNIF